MTVPKYHACTGIPQGRPQVAERDGHLAGHAIYVFSHDCMVLFVVEFCVNRVYTLLLTITLIHSQ